jgi:DNA-binding response OmpR family regulator
MLVQSEGDVSLMNGVVGTAPLLLHSMRPSRILVVEDERHIARLLDHVLRKEGYELLVAHSAEKALAEIDQFKPDALVLDLVLPGMSGLDFLRTIRAEPHSIDCVAIMLSGHWFGNTDVTLPETGTTAQCSKPIAPSTLFRKLRELGVPRQMPWK